MSEVEKAPYHLLAEHPGENCASSVVKTLIAGDVDIDLKSILNLCGKPTPYRLRDYLIQQFERETPYVIAVGAKGNTEMKALLKIKDKPGFNLISEGSRWSSHRIVSRDTRGL